MMETRNYKERKKLLFIINNLVGGGAEKVLIHLLQHLDRAKFDIHLLLVQKEGIYVPVVPSDVSFRWIFGNKLDISSRFLRFFYCSYRKLVLEFSRMCPPLWAHLSGINEYYDIGISFLGGYGTSLLSLKKNKFGKTIGWFHSDLSAYNGQIDKVQLRRYTHFDKIFFVSKDALNGFVCLYPEFQNSSLLEVVYNPVDIPTILSPVEKETGGITLVAIGRLAILKGFHKLLSVHKRLLDNGLNHQLWILGEGEERNRLEAMLQELKITDTCHLLGFRDVYPYLESADVFVLCSDYEGFPGSICEAMILAKPIVATNVTGTREVLEYGRYGLLVENNEQALEDGLEKMIRNPELRAYYSENLKKNQDSFVFSSALTTIEEKLLTI